MLGLILGCVFLIFGTSSIQAEFWTNAGTMNIVRYDGATGTLLANGQVLVAGGSGGQGPIPNAEIFDPSNRVWINASNMASSRFYHTATLLANGKTLIVGGYTTLSFTTTGSTEVYDPTTGIWTTNEFVHTARAEHTATTLHNGKVLIAGGRNAGGTVSIAEIFDPTTGKWTETGALNTPRFAHTAVLLPNGKVLIAGGYDYVNGMLSSSELYDPATGVWSYTGGMAVPRMGHTMTLLTNGGVMAAGGFNFGGVTYPDESELFDSTFTWMWWANGTLHTPRRYHTATLLPDGRVLLAGGDAGNADVKEELFDPTTSTWNITDSMTYGRSSHVATLLPDGRVLVAAGGAGVAELFDPGMHDTNGVQPQIFSITSSVNLGSSLVLTGAQFGCTSGVPLVQLQSLENGQTVFLSPVNWNTNSFVSEPVWNFPPGFALASVIANGIHSAGSIVGIRVPVPITPSATGILTNGTFQISFTNSVGAVFGVLATTNLSLPLIEWARSDVTEIAPGQFQFIDSQVTNNASRFYRFVAP